MSLPLQLIITVIMCTFSALSYAIDCSGLDRKSSAFQTCMLRQENEDRDFRNKIVRENNEREKALTESKRESQSNENAIGNIDTFMPLLQAIDDKLKCKDSPLQLAYDKSFLYMLTVCNNPSYVTLLFNNKSRLARELGSEIENKKVSVYFFNDINIANQTTLITPITNGKAYAVIFTQTASQQQINVIAISEMIKKRSPIEVFIKGEKSSSSFVLSSF